MKTYLMAIVVLLVATVVVSSFGEVSPEAPVKKWSIVRGTWTITNKGLTGQGLSAEVVSGKVFPSDRTVTITMQTISTIGTGSTCCPYYVARANGKFVDEFNKVFIDIWTTGIINLVISTSITYTNNPVQTSLSPFASHTAKMVFLGDNVTIYVDGILYYNVTDSRIGAMGASPIALSSWGTSESTFGVPTVH